MTALNQTSGQNQTSAPLAAGFADPVQDAQRGFRTIMNAMARPGSLQALATGGLKPPAPLTPVVAAIALTLFDYDTPVWLDVPFARSEAVKTFLRFHTGAPIVSEPVEAGFALIADPAHLSSLGKFHQGTLEYPDRSATVILTGQTLSNEGPVHLSGPGIETETAFSTGPVSLAFWDQVKANNAQFPRGVDLIFAGSAEIAALPRSTMITVREA
ncbi:phosphonate C-P lyase system protein PhnH [Roseibium aggregatum]|uniref:Phosphonate C-P lyase system protein PhnH n=1 Tax=Roseibium aggregatum TaxID=187304 RepID=A0A926P4H9_9HYPH|nr:phosphonate C-P lyase system protein PhnH [Roseibium aggregatum]MBD1546797.1 phosphonate C-P lyase system protein PhnH [Roseibium aggregatum]